MEQTCFPGMGVSLDEKIEKAILAFQTFETRALRMHDEGYYLAFSGGKDSIVIKKLAKLAGVAFRSYYNVTTIDPPELIRYMREYHSDVLWMRPKENFFKRCEKKGLPTRLGRWCCEEYKEGGGKGRITVIGVRAAESARRAKMWTTLKPMGDKIAFCPILHWSDDDVWNFIHRYDLPYCSLYDEGHKRLGCVGCPMADRYRDAHFKLWPGFAKLWKRAAVRYWELNHDRIKKDGNPHFTHAFKDGMHYWAWWMHEQPSPDKAECMSKGLFL